MNKKGKRADRASNLVRARLDEKNRRFVLWHFKGKGLKKLNAAFAPLEKL